MAADPADPEVTSHRVVPNKTGQPWRKPGQSWLTVSEVAQLLDMNAYTVRRLADVGTIPSFRMPRASGKPGYRRFSRAAVEAFRDQVTTSGGDTHG